MKVTSNFRFITLSLCFLCIISMSNAQRLNNFSNKNTIENRWYAGGNIGLQFGDQTLIDISPLIGYKISESFHTGISATYKYYNYKKAFWDPYNSKWLDYSSNIFGGSIFGRYFIIPELFAHAEFEMLSLSYDNYYQGNDNIYKATKNEIVPGLFLGGGYRQYISDNASFDIMGLWNFLESENSPYQNPVIRIGFTAGF